MKHLRTSLLLTTLAVVTLGAGVAEAEYRYRHKVNGLAATPLAPLTIASQGGARAWSDGSTALSCREYRVPAAGYSYAGDTGDGLYRIRVAGGGTADVSCDMTTAGGGWTLVGQSRTAQATTLSWYNLGSGHTHWYAGHRLLDTTSETLAKVAANGQSSALVLSGSITSGTHRASNGTQTAWVNKDIAQCDSAAVGNYQMGFGSTAAILGFTPQNACSGAPGSVYIFATGAVSSGCAATNQQTPYVGYTCGSYGSYNSSLEFWVR